MSFDQYKLEQKLMERERQREWESKESNKTFLQLMSAFLIPMVLIGGLVFLFKV